MTQLPDGTATLDMYHDKFTNLLVFPTEKSGSELICLTSGDRRWREAGWL